MSIYETVAIVPSGMHEACCFEYQDMEKPVQTNSLVSLFLKIHDTYQKMYVLGPKEVPEVGDIRHLIHQSGDLIAVVAVVSDSDDTGLQYLGLREVVKKID